MPILNRLPSVSRFALGDRLIAARYPPAPPRTISYTVPGIPAPTPLSQSQRCPADALWYCLIVPDNFHALQLLAYLYADKVGCI